MSAHVYQSAYCDLSSTKDMEMNMRHALSCCFTIGLDHVDTL